MTLVDVLAPAGRLGAHELQLTVCEQLLEVQKAAAVTSSCAPFGDELDDALIARKGEPGAAIG